MEIKLCYTDTDSLIIHIAGDGQARFDTSDYEVQRPLPM